MATDALIHLYLSSVCRFTMANDISWTELRTWVYGKMIPRSRKKWLLRIIACCREVTVCPYDSIFLDQYLSTLGTPLIEARYFCYTWHGLVQLSSKFLLLLFSYRFRFGASKKRGRLSPYKNTDEGNRLHSRRSLTNDFTSRGPHDVSRRPISLGL